MFDLSKTFQLPAQTTDGAAKGVLEDAILDLDTRRVIWWRVDMGGAFGYAPVLVRAACARLTRDKLMISVSYADLEAARDRALKGQDDAIDLTHVPDLVTGPFGYTVSPSMFMALVSAWRRKRDRQGVALPDFAGDQALWASDALGRSVFGPRGPLGRLRDLRITDEGEMILMDVAKKLDGKRRNLRADTLRHLPRKGDHLVVSGQKRMPAWRGSGLQAT